MFWTKKKSAAPAQASAENKQSTADSYFDSALDWESSRIAQIEQSERRAQRDKYIAYGIVGVMAIAIAALMPLKEKVPYLIRENSQTGVTEVIGSLDDKRLNYEEVRDKYWLAQYVRARETYDWYTLQRDYNTVGLLSSPTVGKRYAAQFQGKNALDKTFGNAIQSTVDIVSVVPTERGTGTVRFVKTTKRVNDDGPGTVTAWIATLSYRYQSAAKMKESARMINPFGFQILSYRVDPELGGEVQ